MPLAPAIAASLSAGLPARDKALWIGGLDVLKQPGTGDRYGVPIESITVTEAGPGAISTLTFTIDDPQGVVTLGQGQEVRFHDIARGVPLFLGWVDDWESTRMGLGREIAVTCIGVEALLDWIYVPAFTVQNSLAIIAVTLQQALSQAPGIGYPLPNASVALDSSQATPNAFGGGATCQAGTVIPAGTLRQFAQNLWAATLAGPLSTTAWATVQNVVTVDFYGGLRAWDTSGFLTASKPTDYSALALSTAGPNYPGSLRHRTATGDLVRNVFVVGGNAAGTGMESDGSGIFGATAVLNDSTVLTADARRALAEAYFQAHGIAVSGTVARESGGHVGAPGGERRAGSTLTVTDPQAGVSGYTATVAQVVKTYSGQDEEWTFTYGTSEASGSAYLRRLAGGRLI